MIDYIGAENYKILSDKELLEWQKQTKEQIKQLQSRLLSVNRAIKKRGLECDSTTSTQP